MHWHKQPDGSFVAEAVGVRFELTGPTTGDRVSFTFQLGAVGPDGRRDGAGTVVTMSPDRPDGFLAIADALAASHLARQQVEAT